MAAAALADRSHEAGAAANPNVPERLCVNRGFEIIESFIPKFTFKLAHSKIKSNIVSI